MKAFAIGLFATLLFTIGCTSQEPLPAPEAEAPQYGATDTPEQTDALLRAAATGDPNIMAEAAALLGACHTPTSCAGYGSCGTWSAAITCGEPRCGNTWCGPKCPSSDPLCDRPISRVQPREIYRVCFNAAQQACTQWSSTTAAAAGCGCDEL